MCNNCLLWVKLVVYCLMRYSCSLTHLRFFFVTGLKLHDDCTEHKFGCIDFCYSQSHSALGCGGSRTLSSMETNGLITFLIQRLLGYDQPVYFPTSYLSVDKQ